MSDGNKCYKITQEMAIRSSRCGRETAISHKVVREEGEVNKPRKYLLWRPPGAICIHVFLSLRPLLTCSIFSIACITNHTFYFLCLLFFFCCCFTVYTHTQTNVSYTQRGILGFALRYIPRVEDS